MPAVAVTDMSNLFALIPEFYKAALGIGIKPIVGVEVCGCDGATTRRG